MSLGEAIDRLIYPVAPVWAHRRAVARYQYQQFRGDYDAAKPSRYRTRRTTRGSPDAVMAAAGDSLRAQSRWLDENHDLAKGVLDVLVGNIVGRGIQVEPQIKGRDGELLDGTNRQLRDLWREWSRRPEVTRELDLDEAWRISCRTALRDGEFFTQLVQGNVAGLNHRSEVPLSLEFLEPDLVPHDLHDSYRRIVQGVTKNAWGEPRAYHVYKEHPGSRYGLALEWDTKTIPAERMLHCKVTYRFKQTRGVPIFASVMTRLDDIRDYEESERVAARVAAALTGYIKKDGQMPGPPEDSEPRSLSMEPGMIFDDLRPGEEVGTIKSERPNSQLWSFRKSQLQAVSAGTGASYSSTSRDYDGSYSSQRQELVEQWQQTYLPLRAWFIAHGPRPVWERFVDMALRSGVIRPPRSADRRSLYDADFRGPAMPWIDPSDEVEAAKESTRAGFASRRQIIRERGDSPADVTREIAQERREAQAADLKFTSDPGSEADRGQS